VTAATPVDDAAWVALLPAGTVWLSRPPRRAGTADDTAVGLAADGTAVGFAATASLWSLRSRSDQRLRAYIAVPSRQRPLIVASWDRAVLRYLADTVLSVPPGTGPVLSLVLTVGLRLFRHPGSWLLAVALRVGGAVLVGRPG
jgi:hypothetical protein